MMINHLTREGKFPFLFGGTFIEGKNGDWFNQQAGAFPFLFGGTFIEGSGTDPQKPQRCNFPSFSEGLSLRADTAATCKKRARKFPFLFGGTFIEGNNRVGSPPLAQGNFPSFSEGLSLRVAHGTDSGDGIVISLPFRRDFH